MRLATMVASQMMSVAMTQVAIPVILSPVVTSVVTSKPTNVVTRAMPPSGYGAFCRAILVINGSRITVDAVKIQTATTNATPLIGNPVRSIDAATNASAFGRSDKDI